ncbi:MAG: RluA family pseudouridine synthase [Neisseriales bacterium]|jgi:23S rRNA pseudouridine1911/1915/1917 synthase|nr:MAG: RluA family pseudouridine synthase [Neisseriales bacterium]
MSLSINTEFKISIAENLDLETFDFTIPNNYIGIRTDIALAEIISDLSRSKLTNWLKEGHILINQNPAKPKDKIMGGEHVVVTPPFSEESQAFSPENIDLNVIYEDDQVIVINKPAGLVVHPGAGNWSGTLLNGLLYHYPELTNVPRAGIVHRLDKDTTGLMVVARTLNAQISLVQQLQVRSVSRIYRAFVEGYPFKEGIINKKIGRDPHNRTKMVTLDHGGREAITRYRVLKQFDKICYIECKLETGRTHQIRVHMKDKGFPLIGDPVYGTKKINYQPEVVDAIEQLNRQALHAIKLSFVHPTTNKTLNFKTRMADDMRNLLAALSFGIQLDTEEWDDEDDSNWEIIYAYDKD